MYFVWESPVVPLGLCLLMCGAPSIKWVWGCMSEKWSQRIEILQLLISKSSLLYDNCKVIVILMM